MKFENIHVFNFENAIRGMRNPKNSWDQSDSIFGFFHQDKAYDIVYNMICQYYDEDTLDAMNEDTYHDVCDYFTNNIIIDGNLDDAIYLCAAIGPRDMNLAQSLIRGGSEHRKFMRQIFVTVDITAPLYWQIFCQ